MNRFTHCSLAALLALLLLGFASPALSEHGPWYGTVKGGMTMGGSNTLDLARALPTTANATLNTNNGLALTGAIGYYLFPQIAFETEVSYRSTPYTNFRTQAAGQQLTLTVGGRLTTLALMLNTRYEFHRWESLKPYLLAGVGVAQVTSFIEQANRQSFGVSTQTTAFAYQGGFGLLYPLIMGLNADFSYRYFATSGHSNITNTHHTGLAGLTKTF